jgi:hypothetical protein
LVVLVMVVVAVVVVVVVAVVVVAAVVVVTVVVAVVVGVGVVVGVAVDDGGVRPVVESSVMLLLLCWQKKTTWQALVCTPRTAQLRPGTTAWPSWRTPMSCS